MKQVKEIWRDVAGYEGLYEVSNLGRVRRKKTGRVLRPCKEGGGYPQVVLSKEGSTKPRKIHRLVAEAFLPNPDNLPCINHKDETRDNNHVDNLEWCSYSYNNNYGSCQKKRVKTLQIKYGRSSTIPLKPVICIELNMCFPSITSAEELLGVNRGNLVKSAKKGYRAGGYHWKYAEVEE